MKKRPYKDFLIGFLISFLFFSIINLRVTNIFSLPKDHYNIVFGFPFVFYDKSTSQIIGKTYAHFFTHLFLIDIAVGLFISVLFGLGYNYFRKRKT